MAWRGVAWCGVVGGGGGERDGGREGSRDSTDRAEQAKCSVDEV